MRRNNFKDLFKFLVKKKILLTISILFLVFGLTVSTARAATLYLSPANGQTSIGQTFDVEVRVNSSDQGFNAAQGTIQFPADILQVKSIDSTPA